ncbi:MAG: NAD(P)-binding domain-containing protein [Calditrichaeota bacterium]|nr:NAD(P)-binding domain-containing protein [Calditrichota bacterium]
MARTTIQKELIIIGGGPAGLKAAEIAQEKKIDYVLLEKGKTGQAWKEIRPDLLLLSPCLPQRDWTSLSSKFPIWKLGVQRPYCRASEFAQYLESYCDFFKINVQENTPVKEIVRQTDRFIVLGENDREFVAPVIIVATGIFGNPYIPPIPGVKDNPYVMHSHLYRSKNDFKNQRVLIVGAGNSAAETAIDLVGYSLVYMVSREDLQYFSDTKKLYHIRGVYESYLKELISMEMIRYKAFQQIEEIDRNVVRFRDWKLEVDKIIFATGYHGDLRILHNFNLRVNKNNYPEVTESGESIQYPRLFFGGPLFFQGMSTNVIHGFIRQIPKTMDRIESILKGDSCPQV